MRHITYVGAPPDRVLANLTGIWTAWTHAGRAQLTRIWRGSTSHRLAAIVLLEPELDANYEAVKADTYAWPGEV